MPNRDGTGPQGQGAQTGRALGNCSNAQDQNSNRPCGRGMGIGGGRGMKQGRGQRRGRCENRRR